MIVSSPTELLFGDVYFRLDDLLPRHAVHLKLEGFNPGGSIKMKPAIHMIEDCERRAALRAGMTVVESSSGNLGLALSIVCLAKGYQFICVSDPNISPQTKRLMEAYGAQVKIVNEHDENGGYLGSRIALIKEMLKTRSDIVWLNQYANEANKDAHFKWTAPEILKQFPTLNYLFIGAGTTGTLMGCAEFIRAHSPGTRIIAVDSVGSVTFGGEPGKRYIPGLGTSRRPELVDPSLPDHIIMIPEIETLRMCRWMAQRHGLLVGGSTGTVLCGVRRHVKMLGAEATIVAISPDFGDRYIDTLYSDAWVAQRFDNHEAETPMGPASQHARGAVAAV